MSTSVVAKRSNAAVASDELSILGKAVLRPGTELPPVAGSAVEEPVKERRSKRKLNLVSEVLRGATGFLDPKSRVLALDCRPQRCAHLLNQLIPAWGVVKMTQSTHVGRSLIKSPKMRHSSLHGGFANPILEPLLRIGCGKRVLT